MIIITERKRRYTKEEQKEFLKELKFKCKMHSIERKGEEKLRKRELKAKRDSYKKPRKKIPTSKLIAIYLFCILNIVLAFSMVSMWTFHDLSYLGVLISDVIAQVITYMIYMVKSTKENTSGGITYEMAMTELNNGNVFGGESVG